MHATAREILGEFHTGAGAKELAEMKRACAASLRHRREGKRTAFVLGDEAPDPRHDRGLVRLLLNQELIAQDSKLAGEEAQELNSCLVSPCFHGSGLAPKLDALRRQLRRTAAAPQVFRFARGVIRRAGKHLAGAKETDDPLAQSDRDNGLRQAIGALD